MSDENPEGDAGDTPEVPNMRDLRGVRYIGTADVKVFDVDDLAQVGIERDEPLVWDGYNNHFIPGSEINAAVRDFLATQEDFVVE